MSSAAPPLNGTDLERRQCIKDPQTGRYDCDFNLPSVGQMVARFRDIVDAGRARPEARVWFYTRLWSSQYRPTNQEIQFVFSQCKYWFQKAFPTLGSESNYYINDGINRLWVHAQLDFIKANPQGFPQLGAPGDHDNDHDPATVFARCLWQALSMSALYPEAYLFTQSGDWNSASAWQTVEFPALTQNPNIQRIWRVNMPNWEDSSDSEDEECEVPPEREVLWDRSVDAPLEGGWQCPVPEPAELAERDEMAARAPVSLHIQTTESAQVSGSAQPSGPAQPSGNHSFDQQGPESTSAVAGPSIIPNAQGHEQKLEPRQCVAGAQPGQWNCDFKLPTLQQIVERYRDTADGGMASMARAVWFYTNLDQENDAAALADCFGWLLKNNIDNYYVKNAVGRSWLLEQIGWIQDHQDEFLAVTGGNDPSLIFAICLFEALATSALNPDAYLFTKAAPDTWREKSYWALVEYPALTNNPNIQRIWRVDPRQGQCNDKQLLWERGRDQPLPVYRTCPVLEPLQIPNPATTTNV